MTAIVGTVVLVVFQTGIAAVKEWAGPGKPLILTNTEPGFHTELHLFKSTSPVESTLSFGGNSYVLEWNARHLYSGSGLLQCYSLGGLGSRPKGSFLVQDEPIKNEFILTVDLNDGRTITKRLARNK